MSKLLPRLLAEFLHDRYEYHAEAHGWKTRDECQVPFKDLPEANQNVMIEISMDILKLFSCTPRMYSLLKGKPKKK